MHLNVPLAKAYARELNRLAKQLKLPGPVTLDQLVRAPGVFQTDEELAVEEDFWPAVEKALKKALVADGEDARAGRRAPRAGPGRAHGGDAQGRGPDSEAGAARSRSGIASNCSSASRAPAWRRPALDDERLLKEVVYFADRSDISEELTRLQSHFQQFEDCRKSKEPVGRMLDFLAQEMNREINTIGSKANDSLISREVVTLKAELEKFREQAQNVE